LTLQKYIKKMVCARKNGKIFIYFLFFFVPLSLNSY
jgi:hypothetical protein